MTVAVVTLMWDNVSGFRSKVDWNRSVCQNITLDEDNLEGRL